MNKSLEWNEAFEKWYKDEDPKTKKVKECAVAFLREYRENQDSDT